MANSDNPNGFTPIMQGAGGVARMNTAGSYNIAAAYGTKIFSGDPVKLAGSGKTIALADANDTIIGVFAGCQYTKTTGEIVYSPYWPAAGDALTSVPVVANVYDDRHTLFMVQVDGVLILANIGSTMDHVAGTGSEALGRSRVMLDQSSVGAGNTFTLIGLVDEDDNDYGDHAKVIVQPAMHTLA